MKKNQVQIGGVYTAKVTDKVVRVRIDAESPHGGWRATNLETKRKIRIKSAQRLRSAVSEQTGHAPRSQLTLEETKKLEANREAAKKVSSTGQDKRLSALDAAARVLAEADGPMNAKEMIDAMARKGYWKSPGGKTPQATLYAAIVRELKAKGADARFRKADRGKFTLA